MVENYRLLAEPCRGTDAREFPFFTRTYLILMQLSGLLQRPSCIGKCIGTLVFLHLQDGRDDGLHFPSDEGQNGPVELPPHLSSFINVLPLVDWG